MHRIYYEKRQHRYVLRQFMDYPHTGHGLVLLQYITTTSEDRETDMHAILKLYHDGVLPGGHEHVRPECETGT